MKDIFLMFNDPNAPKTKKPINQNTSPKAVGSWQGAVGKGAGESLEFLAVGSKTMKPNSKLETLNSKLETLN